MYLHTKTANQNSARKKLKSDQNFLLEYLTLEDRTGRLSWNVGKQLPTQCSEFQKKRPARLQFTAVDVWSSSCISTRQHKSKLRQKETKIRLYLANAWYYSTNNLCSHRVFENLEIVTHGVINSLLFSAVTKLGLSSLGKNIHWRSQLWHTHSTYRRTYTYTPTNVVECVCIEGVQH
jgi:hypothetical protein